MCVNAGNDRERIAYAMCELFALSARRPTVASFSLETFAARGAEPGQTGRPSREVNIKSPISGTPCKEEAPPPTATAA